MAQGGRSYSSISPAERGHPQTEVKDLITASDDECEERFSKPQNDKMETAPGLLAGCQGNGCREDDSDYTPRCTQSALLTSRSKREEMLGEHDAHHQNIKGDEAERRLEEYGKDCYLTRYSDHHRSYVLTVCKRQCPNNVIKHFTIKVKKKGECRIEEKGNKEYFKDIKKLLSHYRKFRIDPAIDKIGQPYTEREFFRKEEMKMNRKQKAEDKTSEQIVYSIGFPQEKLLDESDSYHQSITKEEAEQRLQKCGNDLRYLTRYSEIHKSYMLSVYLRSNFFKHFKIINTDDGHKKIEGIEKEFDTLEELLKHYEQNRFDPAFKTIGQRYTEEEHLRKGCIIV